MPRSRQTITEVHGLYHRPIAVGYIAPAKETMFESLDELHSRPDAYLRLPSQESFDVWKAKEKAAWSVVRERIRQRPRIRD